MLVPVISLDAGAGLSGISYSPSQKGLLASFGRDSSKVTFWTLNQIPSNDPPSIGNEMKTLSIDNIMYPSIRKSFEMPPVDLVLYYSSSTQVSQSPITDFAWLPTDKKSLDKESSFLVSCTKDPKLIISNVPRWKPFSWSPLGNIATAGSNSILICGNIKPTAKEFQSSFPENKSCNYKVINTKSPIDPSQYMLDRAKLGYSLNARMNLQVLNELKLHQDDSHLLDTWEYVDRMNY